MIYLFLFLLPIQLGTFFFIPESYINGIRIDYLAPALYLSDIVAVALMILNYKMLLNSLFSRVFGNWKLVIVAIIVVNIFFAIEPLIAGYRVLKILEILAIFVIINKANLNPSKVLHVFLFGALLQCSLVLFQVTQGNSMQGLAYFLGERAFSLSTPGIAKVSLQGVEILRGYGTFPHPNALAGFYLLLYTYFLFLKLRTTNYQLPTTKPLLLALCSLLVVFSFSKIAIFILVLVTTLFVIREKYDCFVCGVSKILIPVFLAVIVFSTQGDTESIEKRVYLAQSALQIFAEHPITGVGLGNYLYAQADIPANYPYVFIQPVHNIFLLLVAELGIPLSLFLMYLFWKYVRRNRDVFVIGNSSLIILFVIFMTGMFDHYWLTIQQNILLLPVIFGLLQREGDMVK